MIRLDCQQGSEEWAQARTGVLTASRVAMLLTSGGAPRMETYYRVTGAGEPSARAHKQIAIWDTLVQYGPCPVAASSALSTMLERGLVEACDPPAGIKPRRKRPELSKSREALICHLAEEWQQGWSSDFSDGESWETGWTERGRELEPQARAAFTLETDLPVRTSGFLMTEDKRCGCSPDGEPPDSGLELKCPRARTHIAYLRANVVPPAYWLQVQFSLWLTGWPRWWFLSYHPHWPSLLLEVEPCEQTHSALDEYVPVFLAELDQLLNWARRQGVQRLAPDMREATQ